MKAFINIYSQYIHSENPKFERRKQCGIYLICRLRAKVSFKLEIASSVAMMGSKLSAKHNAKKPRMETHRIPVSVCLAKK